MNTGSSDEEAYLQEFDVDAPEVRRIKHPLIHQVQVRALLADDVADWLAKQDAETRKHVNEMIRHVMAVSEC